MTAFKDLEPKFIERYLAVATAMEDLQEVHDKKEPTGVIFNMSVWGSYKEEPQVWNGSNVEIEKPHMNCQTAACAAGHAAFHPWFRERGLDFEITRKASAHYKQDEHGDWEEDELGNYIIDHKSETLEMSIYYKSPDGKTSSMEAFFGHGDVSFTDPCSYGGGETEPKQVARYIRTQLRRAGIENWNERIDLGDTEYTHGATMLITDKKPRYDYYSMDD